MHRLVNLSRLCLVDGENIHQILHIGIAQSLQVRETGFNQRERLLFSDGQRTRQRLRRLRNFLLNRCCRRYVLGDINLQAGQSRS